MSEREDASVPSKGARRGGLRPYKSTLANEIEEEEPFEPMRRPFPAARHGLARCMERKNSFHWTCRNEFARVEV